MGGSKAFNQKGSSSTPFGGWCQWIYVDQSTLLVVLDIDTGSLRLVDEEASVRVEDVSGPAEDGQWP